tara:strand:- start:8168 stop:9187 length:1020 start_codon:yes stop_codon:yes gene_type:complete
MKFKKLIKITIFSSFILGINIFANLNGQVDLPEVGNSKAIEDKNIASINVSDNKTKDPEVAEEKYIDKHMPWKKGGKTKSGFGSVNNDVFKELLEQNFPMSPEQMKIYKEALDRYEQAMQYNPKNPNPVISTKNVSIDPGSSPVAIRIATGYVSTILFIDETGANWPIAAYDIGNTKDFNVQWDKKSNLLLIQGMKPYSNTNLVILLKDLDTPVIFNLVNDQKAVDYRLDLRIPRLGPNAKMPIMQMGLPDGVDDELMSLLDGVPPRKNTQLIVHGGEAQAWLNSNGNLLLRTRLTLLSPSYDNSLSSADGMHVYKLNKTPLILAARDGEPVQLSIQGY